MKIASNMGTVISGYEDDRYLLGESNSDCVVISLAGALALSYTAAHKVASKFGRQTGRGMRTFQVVKMYKELEEKGKVRKLDKSKITTFYSSTRMIRSNKLSTFIKNNPIGTFILLVKCHAITVKDGTVLQSFPPTNQHIRMGWKVVEK